MRMDGNPATDQDLNPASFGLSIFRRANAGPFTNLTDCGLHSGQETLGQGRVIFLKEKISVLTQDVISRRRFD